MKDVWNLEKEMDINEKYQKPTLDYYASFIWRKIISGMLAYPEFIFMAKILLGLALAVIFFVIFRRIFKV